MKKRSPLFVPNLFESEKLIPMGKELHGTYVAAHPFPHIVIDQFMQADILEQALCEFPHPDPSSFYSYDNPLEKKLAFDQILKLPPTIREILIQMNSPCFLRFLEELTGIEGLIPDPYYRGCGIHSVERNGKLDIHLDFNKHKKLGLSRKLNLILYLNKNWSESFGGSLELWSALKKNGEWVLNKCERKILPLFNRLIVFACTEQSFHGHPEPLNCPSDWSRKAIMTAYYISPLTTKDKGKPHSTVYMKRPNDPVDEKLEALRKNRSYGRLVSNIENQLTS